MTRSCAVCGMHLLMGKVLSSVQRTMIFLKRGIFVPPGTRCCRDHVVRKQLTVESFNKICVSKADHWTLDAVEFQMLLTDVRSILSYQNGFSFDDPSSMNEEAYKSIVGLTRGNSIWKLEVMDK